MKQLVICYGTPLLLACILLGCHINTNSQKRTKTPPLDSSTFYRSFPNLIAWGRHLVEMGGCNDCHTPDILTNKGPQPDTTRYLAGHPEHTPLPRVNRKEIERKGLAVTRDETAWIGPWGITYAANLTPDKQTGIGNWTVAQFIRCFRGGKENGAPAGRPLLPPMSGVAAQYNHTASNAELKAIFAYLRSIKPVHNAVPASVPPLGEKR